MAFPQRKYYRLETLEKRWGVEGDEIIYAIENGLLRACIWLPPCFVEKRCKENGRFVVADTKQLEGLVSLRSRDCRKVLSKGESKVCCFGSLDEEGVQFTLSSDEPEQEPVVISIHHMVVCHQDCRAFEEAHDLLPKETDQHKIRLIRPKEKQEDDVCTCFTHSNRYQIVELDGTQFILGSIQARVVEKLHQASRTENPWIHGKILLYEAGSTGQRLRDVFKSQKQWRILIESDGKGYYRLNMH
jgi:hypothetical protein